MSARHQNDSSSCHDTLSLRLAAAVARVDSPVLFRLLSPLLASAQSFEAALRSFILVDLANIFGVPKGLSAFVLSIAAAWQVRRAYLRQPRLVATLCTLYVPLKHSLQSRNPLKRQDNLVSFWTVFGLLQCAEALKVHPLSAPATPQSSPSSTSYAGQILAALVNAWPVKSRPDILTRLFAAPASASSSTSLPTTPSKPRVSLMKRTFGPNWPLFKLVFLLCLQCNGSKPAAALVQWLLQPLHYLLTKAFSLGLASSDPSTTKRTVLKVVYEEADAEPPSHPDGMDPEPPSTPSPQLTPRRPASKTARQPAGEDNEWEQPSAMLDSGILSSAVWNSSSPRPANHRKKN